MSYADASRRYHASPSHVHDPSVFAGPQVSVRVGPRGYQYKLPKALLCKRSPYFAAMFEGAFKEGGEQSTILEEMEGVVTPRSFEMLVQWLCVGRIVFREPQPEDSVTLAIEFSRLADMCGVADVESLVAQNLRAIILGHQGARGPDSNTHCLTSEHIISAANLPDGHAVRTILAAASVTGYLLKRDYKFKQETLEVPSYSADLLKAVKSTLDTLSHTPEGIIYMDPITEISFYLRY